MMLRGREVIAWGRRLQTWLHSAIAERMIFKGEMQTGPAARQTKLSMCFDDADTAVALAELAGSPRVRTTDTIVWRRT
jgi:hypothetical protein